VARDVRRAPQRATTLTVRDRIEERLAAELVAHIAGVRTAKTDVPRAPDATYDYRLERNGNDVGALEVTMLVDENRARFDGALYERQVLDAVPLTGSWHVAIAREALEQARGVRSIRTNIVQALAELEEEGESSFQRDEMRPYRALMGLPDDRPPRIIDRLTSREVVEIRGGLPGWKSP
jgi:hypothetical protein